jgi:hypothetical protein
LIASLALLAPLQPIRAPRGVRVVGIFNSPQATMLLLYTNELSLFKAWPAGQIVSVPHALATKMMFWAVAQVSFRAAKIVSCNNRKKIHGLRSKLLQLFYFNVHMIRYMARIM